MTHHLHHLSRQRGQEAARVIETRQRRCFLPVQAELEGEWKGHSATPQHTCKGMRLAQALLENLPLQSSVGFKMNLFPAVGVELALGALKAACPHVQHLHGGIKSDGGVGTDAGAPLGAAA